MTAPLRIGVLDGDDIGLEIVPAERREQVAQGVHGWSPPEAGSKDRVQALALESDKGDDPLVGECTRQHGENGEQQQVAQAAALPLRATWIAHLGERGKQGSKWHQGDLHEAGKPPP